MSREKLGKSRDQVLAYPEKKSESECHGHSHEKPHEREGSEKEGVSEWLHCGVSLLSCKQYTELASRKLDNGKLSTAERVQYWIHKMLCLMCRRFERQMKLIEQAAFRYHSRPIPETEVGLSPDAKARINAQLKSAQGSSQEIH